MEIITKSFAEVSGLPDTKEAPFGSFQVILSTPTKDLEGDELKTLEWELPLPDHITFDIDHGMSAEKTIGSGKPYIDARGFLMVDGTYASTKQAQDLRALVNEKHIRTVSVAFLTKRIKGEDGKITIKRTLLNGGFVAIPANPEAVVTSAKSLEDATAKNLADAKKKSILNSVEALQDRVNDAIEDTYPDEFGSLLGVIPGDAGTGYVVWNAYDQDDWDSETVKQDFTDDGSVVTLVGERVEVDTITVILPNADAERDATKNLSADTADTASKDAVDAVSAEENEKIQLQARSLIIQAEALLTL